HVHHFLHRVDVRHLHVAVRVGGVRVTKVIDDPSPMKSTYDPANPAADALARRGARAADRIGREHDLLGLV
ncbi:hypothetical protein DN504_30995, partial [Burkholderia multivorans]